MSQLIQPIIVKIFLYSNTIVDRKLIAELRKSGQTFGNFATKKQFYVMKELMAKIVRVNFRKELESEKNYPANKGDLKYSSLYYLDNLLTNYTKLRYFEVGVIDDEVFTRRESIDKPIAYDFRIVYSKVDLPVAVKKEDLVHFENAFEVIGIWTKGNSYDRDPYLITEASNLVRNLEAYHERLDPNGQEAYNVREVKSFFDNKLYDDNTKLLVIMRR